MPPRFLVRGGRRCAESVRPRATRTPRPNSRQHRPRRRPHELDSIHIRDVEGPSSSPRGSRRPAEWIGPNWSGWMRAARPKPLDPDSVPASAHSCSRGRCSLPRLRHAPRRRRDRTPAREYPLPRVGARRRRQRGRPVRAEAEGPQRRGHLPRRAQRHGHRGALMAAVAAKGRTATERGLRAHVQDLARALAAMGAETKASAPTSTPSRVGGPPRRVVRH